MLLPVVRWLQVPAVWSPVYPSNMLAAGSCHAHAQIFLPNKMASWAFWIPTPPPGSQACSCTLLMCIQLNAERPNPETFPHLMWLRWTFKYHGLLFIPWLFLLSSSSTSPDRDFFIKLLFSKWAKKSDLSPAFNLSSNVDLLGFGGIPGTLICTNVTKRALMEIKCIKLNLVFPKAFFFFTTNARNTAIAILTLLMETGIWPRTALSLQLLYPN